jgi:hypothetical protein
MTFKSDFALLDVKAGRAALAKRIAKGTRIPVIIHGTITGQWGRDDGTSIEFEVDVTKVKEFKRAHSK